MRGEIMKEATIEKGTEAGQASGSEVLKILILGNRKVRVEITEEQVGVMTIVEERPDYTLISPALAEKRRALGIPLHYRLHEYNPVNRLSNCIAVPWQEVVEFVKYGELWERRK
jgi:hypothetical protein